MPSPKAVLIVAAIIAALMISVEIFAPGTLPPLPRVKRLDQLIQLVLDSDSLTLFASLAIAAFTFALWQSTHRLKALLSGHGFEFGLGDVGPWQEIVDPPVWVAVDDPCDDIGEIGERLDAV